MIIRDFPTSSVMPSHAPSHQITLYDSYTNSTRHHDFNPQCILLSKRWLYTLLLSCIGMSIVFAFLFVNLLVLSLAHNPHVNISAHSPCTKLEHHINKRLHAHVFNQPYLIIWIIILLCQCRMSIVLTHIWLQLANCSCCRLYASHIYLVLPPHDLFTFDKYYFFHSAALLQSQNISHIDDAGTPECTIVQGNLQAFCC